MQGAPKLSAEGITVVKVNYLDNTELTAALQGVHTVLSFLTGDPENAGQKALIAACIEAGVKRFAPSEWAAYVPLYRGPPPCTGAFRMCCPPHLTILPPSTNMPGLFSAITTL